MHPIISICHCLANPSGSRMHASFANCFTNVRIVPMCLTAAIRTRWPRSPCSSSAFTKEHPSKSERRNHLSKNVEDGKQLRAWCPAPALSVALQPGPRPQLFAPPKKRQRELVLRGVVPIQRHFRNARARGKGVHSNGANAVARKEPVGGSIYALSRSDRASRGLLVVCREACAHALSPATRQLCIPQPRTGTTKTPATALTVAGRVADRAKGEEGARGGY